MTSDDRDRSLETGDEVVDRQHRDIKALVADVEHASDDPAEIMDVLERLMDHVECHFATEEDLMHRESYPEDAIAEHVADHHHLTETAREAVLDFRSGGLTTMAPLASLLGDWLSNHVERHDRALVNYVRERGGAAVVPEEWVNGKDGPT